MLDLLQSQRHQTDSIRSLEAQVKLLTTKEASKTKAEEDQPILSGMKMIQGSGAGFGGGGGGQFY